MGWPQSQDYNEAIQNAKTCFKDPELSKGAAVTNPLGMPLPCSGNFADVYQVHCPDTKTRWAVKCFTRGDPKGLEERYAKIDQHLQQAKLPFAVGFRYLVEGIRVRKEWHPVLKMQWVEGYTLNHFVRDNLDKPNVLDALLQIWVRMGKRLREADMAHADLQHGNVMLVAGSTSASLAVKLIDYDGMWVPALEGKKSGEVGHPAYQHTKRLYEGTYSKEVDRFPLLVVATALRCLRVAGRPLWEKFDNGDNLLFREADLAAPERSPLFAELAKLQDAQAQKLVDALLKATTEPLEDTPPIDILLGESAKKQITATKPTPAAPLAEAAFADLGDLEPVDTATAPRRRRDESAPNGKKWVFIGGGAGAALLATVLVLALSGGGKKEPENPANNNSPQADNRKEDKPAKTTPPAPLQLRLAALPNVRLIAGQSQTVNVLVNGHNGAAVRTTWSNLPQGVTTEKVNEDVPNGRAVWRLTAAADAVANERTVSVVVVVGEARTQGDLSLSVTRAEVAVAPPLGEGVVKPGPVRKQPRRLEYGGQSLIAVGFSPDMSKVIGCSNRHSFTWEVQTGNPGRGGQLADTAYKLFLLPEGGFVSATPRHEVTLEGPQGGAAKLLGTHPGQLVRLAVSRNGKRALSSSGAPLMDKDNKPVFKDNVLVWEHLVVKVWDVDKGKELWTLPRLPNLVTRLAISGDGKTALGVLNQLPNAVVRWDLDTGREIGRLTPQGRPFNVLELALSNDGKRAVLANVNNSLELWDCENSKLLLNFGGARLAERVNALQFSPDDRHLLSGGGVRRSQDAAEGCVARLWQVDTGKEVLNLSGHTAPITSLSFSPDGRRAVTSSGKEIALWDLSTDRAVEPPPPEPPPIKPPPTKPPLVVDKRTAPPTEQDQATALTNLKQVFADEYARAKPTDRVARQALADTLLAKGRDIKDNATDRYVLIQEAAGIYQQLGSAASVFVALDVLADDYAVDRVALKEKALKELSKLPAPPAAQKQLAEACLAALDDARDAESFEALSRLADFAETLVAKSQDAATRLKVNAAIKEARELLKESQAALDAAKLLAMQPDDAAANLTRGKFLCFRLGAWQRGLPLLARGADVVLKELATRDTATPDSAEERAKLADGWFDLSKRPDVGKLETLRRAAHWYGLALDAGLTALNKERVEKQLKLIEPQLPATRNLQAGGEVRKLEERHAPVEHLAFLPDGARLVTANTRGERKLWDVHNGKEEKTFSGSGSRFSGLAVSPDGAWLATTQHNIYWVHVPGTMQGLGQGIGYKVLTIAPVGKSKRLVAGTAEGCMVLLDDVKGSANTLDATNHPGAFPVVAACTGGGGLAVAGSDSGAVLLYSLQATVRQTPLRLGSHKGAVLGVALVPDGSRVISSGDDKTVRVWDVKQRSEVRRLVGHGGTVTHLAVSTDGRRLASCGDDGTVRVWDLTSYQEIRRFVGHVGRVNCVAFAPDGRRLASAGEDKTIRIWGF